MIESEGITESVKAWRTDAIAAIADALGNKRVRFEAADPEVFAWYIKSYGPEVNLFVDHSQIVPLEHLRAGIKNRAAINPKRPASRRCAGTHFATRSKKHNL